MTAQRLLHALLFTVALLLPACGGTDGDDTEDNGSTVEQTDDALKPRPPILPNNCSTPDLVCRDAKGRYIGTAAGCSIACRSGQTAQCYSASCGVRVVIDASCVCWVL